MSLLLLRQEAVKQPGVYVRCWEFVYFADLHLPRMESLNLGQRSPETNCPARVGRVLQGKKESSTGHLGVDAVLYIYVTVLTKKFPERQLAADLVAYLLLTVQAH